MNMLIAVLLLFLVAVLLVVLERFLDVPAQPVVLSVRQIRSNNTMADVLTYKVSVGPVVDTDVTVRQLSVYVDGAEAAREVRSYSPETTDLGNVIVPQGSSVVLRLVDVDDAGNQSTPAVLEFVATDTLPPAQPGSLGVTLVSEQRVVEPAVEPTSDNVEG